jgi:hypothetical protein
MHDSQLGVNTWIASDNGTELHTIDLNNGQVDAGAAIEGTTLDEGENAN